MSDTLKENYAKLNKKYQEVCKELALYKAMKVEISKADITFEDLLKLVRTTEADITKHSAEINKTLGETAKNKPSKHKAILVKNLMYYGCEDHWRCEKCGVAVPLHCFRTKAEFENENCYKYRESRQNLIY